MKFFLFLIPFVAFFFNPLGSNIFDLAKIEYLSLLFFIICSVYILKALVSGHFSIYTHGRISFVFLLWILSLLISTVFSTAPQLSFWGSYFRSQGFITHLVLLGFLFTFINLFRREKFLHSFLTSTVIVGVMVSIHGLFQQLNIFTFSNNALAEFSDRSFSTLGQPNALGQFLILPTWIAGQRAFENRGKWRVLYVVILILLLSAMFFSANRGSILGIIVGATFFLFTKLRIKNLYKWIFGAGMIGLSLSVILFLAPTLRSLFTRFHLWSGALELSTNHPLIGSGLETFQNEFQSVASAKLYGFERLFEIADRAHNIFLDTLVTQGVLGLAILLIVLYCVISKAFIKRGDAFYSAILVSFFVSYFFGFPFIADYLLFFAALSIFVVRNFQLKMYTIEGFPKVLAGSLIVILISGGVLFHNSRNVYSDTLFNIANFQFMQVDAGSGLKGLIKAANLNPRQSYANYHLADVFSNVAADSSSEYAAELLNRAHVYADEGGKFQGYDFSYYILKGRIFTAQNDFDNAETAYKAGFMVAPNNPLLLKEWGEMYFQNGDYKNAALIFEKFFDLIPEIVGILNENDPSWQELERLRIFKKHVPGFDRVLEMYYLTSVVSSK